MRTPAIALLWECGRNSGPELLMRLGGAIFFGLCLSIPGLDKSQLEIIPVLITVMLGVNSIFSFTWLGGFESSSGFAFRLGFTRPVTTRKLVLVPLAFVAIAAWLSYVLPALAIGWIQTIRLPILMPATVAMFVTTILATVSWSVPNRAERIFCLGLAMTAVFGAPIILFSIFGPEKVLKSMSSGELYQLGFPFYMAVVIGLFVAAVINVFSIHKQRHGEGISLVHFGQYFTLRNDAPPARLASRFRSPFFAQLWCEWRSFGTKVLMFAAAVVLCTLILFVAIYWKFPVEQSGGRIALCAVFVVGLSPFLLQIVGCESANAIRFRQGVPRISAFDLTRPVSNERILIARLLMVAISSLLGWFCVVVPVGFAVWLANDFDIFNLPVAEMPGILQAVGWGWIVLFAVRFVMLFLYSSAFVMTLGLLLPVYARKFAIVGMIGFPISLLMVIDISQGFRFREWWLWLGVVTAAAQAMLSIWFVYRSIVSGAISRSSLIFVFGLFFGSLLLDWNIYRLVGPELPTSIPLQVTMSMLLSQPLPLAFIICLPLVLGLHRNQ